MQRSIYAILDSITMISNPRSNVTSCSPNISQGSHQQEPGANSRSTRDRVICVDSNPSLISESNDHHSTSLLYHLSALTEKFHQIQSLLLIPRQFESASETLASLTTSVQEMIVTASSMMLTCQQMAINNAPIPHHQPNTEQCQQMAIDNSLVSHPQQNTRREEGEATTQDISLDWYGESYNQDRLSYDIVELNFVDLLAKYTHYCQICAKGFKRDTNLRMHMRAHGDEYKSVAALSNKTNQNDKTSKELARLKYSCPQEGCKWNRKHAKFQPLKSMICAKNHYKRTHCPKMYVCKRCTRKQFSVLSDLRTHEKHCGDMKWKCSCGTTFSRKGKLMGHVGLFVGHAPVNNVVARNKILASSNYTN